MTHSLSNGAIRQQYDAAGFAGRVGWGERPALLVIDMAKAWVDPRQRLGSDLSGVLQAIQAILGVYNFHVIVPREAVGDRSASAHEANLFDVDARYADVLPLAAALEHLRAPLAQAARAS